MASTPHHHGVDSSASGKRHPVEIEGRMSLFVDGLPEDLVMASGGTIPGMKLFMYAWIDNERGASGHVSFPAHMSPDDCASIAGGDGKAKHNPPGNGEKLKGQFRLSTELCNGDSHLLKVQCCVRLKDPVSRNKRTFTVAVSCADLDKLLSGEEEEFDLKDSFDSNDYVIVSMRMSNASDFRNHPSSADDMSKPLLKLGASALDRIEEWDKVVQRISDGFIANVKKNKMNFTPGVSVFMGGITAREFGGRDFNPVDHCKSSISTSSHAGANQKRTLREIPQLRSHYAIMHAQEDTINRFMPIAIVVYHMYLKIVHSGETAGSVLAMGDSEFGIFFPQGLQITCDAGLVPYERDAKLCLTLNCKGKGGLFSNALADTENLACLSEATFVGREIRDKRPISVTKGASLQQIMDMIHQQADGAASTSTTRGGMGHRLLDQTTQFVSGVEHEPSGLRELSTEILTDDCESLTLLAHMAKKTSLAMHHSTRMQARLAGTGKSAGQALREACQGFAVFKNFTPKSWDLMAGIFDRGNTMLEQGHLRVMTTVGLASAASAEEVAKDASSLGGHCFNVGYLKTPSMEKSVCELLEGTSAMISVPIHDGSTRYRVRLFSGETGKVQSETVWTLAELLPALGCTVGSLTQIANAPNGAHSDTSGGWAFKSPVTAWVGRTMAIASLDSDPKYPLHFYNRIMYTGWSCAGVAGGQGSLPVQEPQSATPSRGGSHSMYAGCHPYDLNSPSLRGISAELSPEEQKLMADIMEETTPPMVKNAVFQKLAEFWVPCKPAEDINTKTSRESGVKYIRVAAMETPGVPEYIPLFLEAKGQLVSATNAINRARPDSDGIIGTVCALGTGVHILLDVPDYASDVPSSSEHSLRCLTYVESMKEAMQQIGWPARVTPVHGHIQH